MLKRNRLCQFDGHLIAVFYLLLYLIDLICTECRFLFNISYFSMMWPLCLEELPRGIFLLPWF